MEHDEIDDALDFEEVLRDAGWEKVPSTLPFTHGRIDQNPRWVRDGACLVESQLRALCEAWAAVQIKRQSDEVTALRAAVSESAYIVNAGGVVVLPDNAVVKWLEVRGGTVCGAPERHTAGDVSGG